MMKSCDEALSAVLPYLREEIGRIRVEKIAATQRGADPAEVAAIETRMYDAIGLWMAMREILGGENHE